MSSQSSWFAVFVVLLLAGCQSPSKFATSNEPYRSMFQQTLRDKPEDQFARACHGDMVALHAFFIEALDPSLDGAAAENVTAIFHGIRSYLGDRRFFDALSHEPLNTQRMVRKFAPDR